MALDGTKVKANASKHKAMSYGRMQEKQQQIREAVKRILAEAEAVDEEEDRRYGNKGGDELPEELQRRETRLAKLKQARKTLEERARQKAEAEGKTEEAAQQAQPEDKDQYHFTDPESRIMKSGDGFVQAYNAQAAVLAGSGYCSEENLRCWKSAEPPEKKIEGHLATGKQKHGEFRQPCPRGPLPKAATRVDRMTRKLQTKAGRPVCALRKCVVEPVFGQNKQGRGIRQFLLRGIRKVKGKWALVFMTHKVLRLYAARPAQ